MIKEISAFVTWAVYTLVLIIIFYNAMTIPCLDTNSVAHDECQSAKSYATIVFSLLVGGPPIAIILAMIGISAKVEL